MWTYIDLNKTQLSTDAEQCPMKHLFKSTNQIVVFPLMCMCMAFAELEELHRVRLCITVVSRSDWLVELRSTVHVGLIVDG